MNNPLVSVMMNCFNGEQYLHDSIQSVLNQTYQNWEIVFWDNCSTDNTAHILREFQDKRIKYFKAESHSKKLYEARNKALKFCNGSLISFLDVDDWWAETKLQTQINLFNDPEIGVAASNYFLVNELNSTNKNMNIKFESTSRPTNILMKDYCIALVTIMVRKELLNDIGGFNDDYHIIGDFDLIMKLTKISNLGFSSEPLAFLRKHANNESLLKRNLMTTELKDWISNASNNPDYSSLPNFSYLKAKYYYSLAVSSIVENKKGDAIKYLFKPTKFFFIIKLMILILLPRIVLKRFLI